MTQLACSVKRVHTRTEENRAEVCKVGMRARITYEIDDGISRHPAVGTSAAAGAAARIARIAEVRAIRFISIEAIGYRS